MRNFLIILGVSVVFIGLWQTCSHSSKPRYAYNSPNRTSVVTPVDKYIRDLSDEKSYSIVLHDMELDESKGIYRHKYRITKNVTDSTSKPYVMEWVNVDEAFFAENVDNMGLELASKTADGKVHKTPSPAGFNGYVGNTQYGNWKQDNQGNKFWEYYGQYAFMSSLLNASQPRIYQNTYSHYDSYRNDPYTRAKPYYGTKENSFGTNSPETKKSNPNFFERKQQQEQFSNFKQKVAQNPRKYTRATDRDPSTTYTKANKSSSSSYSDRPSSSNRPSTSSSSKSSSSYSSSSKSSTSSSSKSSSSYSTPSRSSNSSSASAPSRSSSTPSRSSSSYSSSSRSSSPSRSSSSSSSSRSSSSSSSRSSSRRK
jgi:hypothetical protein